VMCLKGNMISLNITYLDICTFEMEYVNIDTLCAIESIS
jgi:hypothetical protein